MTWLNYHHLHYFYVIAKEGGVAQAALRLRVGQPALSTQLKQLEQALGYALFDRKGRKLVLTDRGRIVYDYAAEIFRLGHEMLEAANDQLPGHRSHLQVGALDSVPKSAIHRLVQAAYQQGPCYVSVLEGEGDKLFRELKAHRLDLAITNSPAALDATGELYTKRVAEMRVIVCGAPKFKALKGGFPQSLAGQPFVLPTVHSKLRRDVDHYMETHAIRIAPIGETQDIEVQKLLALSGTALVAVAAAAVERDLREGALVELGSLDHVSEQLWLTSVSRRVENPIAAKLIRSFRM